MSNDHKKRSQFVMPVSKGYAFEEACRKCFADNLPTSITIHPELPAIGIKGMKEFAEYFSLYRRNIFGLLRVRGGTIQWHTTYLDNTGKVISTPEEKILAVIRSVHLTTVSAQSGTTAIWIDETYL